MSFRSATDFLTTEWNVSSAVDIEEVAILKKNQPTTVASRRNTLSPLLVNNNFSLMFFIEFKELVVQELVVQELVGLVVGGSRSLHRFRRKNNSLFRFRRLIDLVNGYKLLSVSCMEIHCR
jgi:hypothetical protein